MPDASGRFQMEDGFRAARQITQFFEWNRRIDQSKQTDAYLDRIGKGEKINSGEEDYNYRAHLTASAMQMQSMRADQEFQAAEFENNEAQRRENQADIDGRLVKAEYLMSRHRGDEAMDTLLPIYQYLPDGNQFKGFVTDDAGNVDRSQMILVGEDGKTEFTEPTPTVAEAMTMAVRFSKAYKDTYHKSKQRASETNLKNALNHQIWTTEDGTEAIYVPFVDVGKTGDYILRETWKDPKTGKTLKGFDEETGKIVEGEHDFRPPAYWKQEADKKGAETGRENIEARTEATKQDTEIKKDKAPLERENLKAQTNLANKRADAAGSTSGTKAEEKQQKKFKADLELLLEPFTGSKNAYDMEGNLTDEGKTALDAAIKLVVKYNAKEELDGAEKKKIKYAIKVVDIYNKMSATVAEKYKDEYGKRADGTPKGKGFLGELKRTDGRGFSTEISIGVNIDGKETEIPTLVPTLSQDEINHLLGGGEVTKEIAQKATKHAKKRIAEGKSPFLEANNRQKASWKDVR
ncbi:MAG: hypothetical protein HGJ94_18270 [Desulfosarcina sp.]|nr:hypothetical protein [Desulfosarcina sp.]